MKRGLGAEIYAFCEMAEHVGVVMEFYATSGCEPLSFVGFEDSNNLHSHLSSRKVVPGKYPAQHFWAIQDGLTEADPADGQMSVFCGSSVRANGMSNPADGLTKHRSDLAPLLVKLMKRGFHVEERRSLEPLPGAVPPAD